MKIYELDQHATHEYPLAGQTVGGLRVGDSVKNTGSISSSLEDYKILKGIRSVPLSEFPGAAPRKMFYARNDLERVEELAQAIKHNGYIDPLIVVIDNEGPYVLEGGHRLAALYTLGVKELPAMVVHDLDELNEDGKISTKASLEQQPEQSH